MLKRKIEDQLLKWKSQKDKKPLVIKGVRQCGKSYIVSKFAEENYKYVVKCDFFRNPELNQAFEGSLDPDTIIMMLSVMMGDQATFVPHETIIIFDEIQECPEARTSLKFFREDGRFDVVCTGFLLGVSGYGDVYDEESRRYINKTPRSIPVGNEEIIDMYPLDFEEFLWANGIKDNVIQVLKECLEKELPVPSAIHNRMNELMRYYLVVGGMPEVVNKFVETKQMNEVLKLQRTIVNEYRDDMVKYAAKLDKSRIRQAFDSIPKQLSKEYKKFQYSKVKHGGRANEYEGSLQWIEDAGIITRSYNLSITELPLEGNKIDEEFKVFMNDSGLLTSMFEDGTQLSILKGDLYTYKGALYENLVTSFFTKMPKEVYYFKKDTLEVDHIIRYKSKVTIVETKAGKGSTYSTNMILEQYDKYHVDQAIKLGDYNVGRVGNKLTLPTYMGFLLKES